MLRYYLYFNAFVYVAFAFWCTLEPLQTSQQLGYLMLSSSGQSEYLVVYGGIELGLGAFFFYCARHAERAGLVLALALYAPIVLFRWFSIVKLWPVAQTTVAVGSLETALLLVALVLWRKSQGRSSL
jgi:hypothetical protein